MIRVRGLVGGVGGGVSGSVSSGCLPVVSSCRGRGAGVCFRVEVACRSCGVGGRRRWEVVVPAGGVGSCCTFILGSWWGQWRGSNVFPPWGASGDRMNVQLGRRCTFILFPGPGLPGRSAWPRRLLIAVCKKNVQLRLTTARERRLNRHGLPVGTARAVREPPEHRLIRHGPSGSHLSLWPAREPPWPACEPSASRPRATRAPPEPPWRCPAPSHLLIVCAPTLSGVGDRPPSRVAG